MKVALTIAGSDSGGGAGIQADLKTFQELGTFGTSVITAITAQNTVGVHDVHPIPTATIAAQLDAVLSDFEVAAVKTGMLFSADIIALVSEKLTGRTLPLVIDPVMIAKGGANLLQQQAVEAMKTLLIPLATIITPNIPEAEVLAGMQITNEVEMKEAAQRLLALGTQVVIIKGGHAVNPSHARDYIATKDEAFIVETPFVPTKQTHGTGCTFSAALAAALAKGQPLRQAVRTAKQFIQSAISHPLHLGAGHGPTNHSAFNRFERFEVTVYEA